jgi:hypothetical protein
MVQRTDKRPLGLDIPLLLFFQLLAVFGYHSWLDAGLEEPAMNVDHLCTAPLAVLRDRYTPAEERTSGGQAGGGEWHCVVTGGEEAWGHRYFFPVVQH